MCAKRLPITSNIDTWPLLSRSGGGFWDTPRSHRKTIPRWSKRACVEAASYESQPGEIANMQTIHPPLTSVSYAATCPANTTGIARTILESLLLSLGTTCRKTNIRLHTEYAPWSILAVQPHLSTTHTLNQSFSAISSNHASDHQRKGQAEEPLRPLYNHYGHQRLVMIK